MQATEHQGGALQRDAHLAARPGIHSGPLLRLADALRSRGYRFSTVTPATQARVNARHSNAWATDMAGIFGWSRRFRAGDIDSELFELILASGIARPEGNAWRSVLRVSSLGEDLYFHSAYPTTDAHSVFFGPDTVRFVRALDAALPGITRPVLRAADIGCGAGPAAIHLARRFPAAEVLGIDTNEDALRLAQVNGMLAGVDNLLCTASDMLSDVDGQFDVLVSNPPYLLDEKERCYRHGGGELGEGFSVSVVEAAIERLAPGGTLLLYTGVAIANGQDRFLQRAAALLNEAQFHWTYEELDPDVFGEELEQPAYRNAERIAAVWLVATKAGAQDA